MQRIKEILSQHLPAFSTCVAVLILVGSVFVVRNHFAPPVEPGTDEKAPQVQSVKKMSAEEIDSQPAVQKLKEQLAAEAGISAEELFEEKKPEAAKKEVASEIAQRESKDLGIKVAEEKPALVAEASAPIEDEMAETTVTVAKLDLPTNEEIVIEAPIAPKKVAPAKVAPVKVAKKAAKKLAKKVAQTKSRKPVLFARLAPQTISTTVTVAPPIDELIDSAITVSDAVDTTGPLDTLADHGLAEFDPTHAFALSMWRPVVTELEPLESRMSLRLGVQDESDLSELYASLDKMKSADLAVSEPPEATAPRVIETRIAAVPEASTPEIALAKPEPQLVEPTISEPAPNESVIEKPAPADRTPLAMMAKPDPVTPKMMLDAEKAENSALETDVATSSVEPVIVFPTERVVNETKVAMNTPRDAEPELATQEKEPVLVTPQIIAPAPVIVAPVPKVSMATEPTLVRPATPSTKSETTKPQPPGPRQEWSPAPSDSGDGVDYPQAKKARQPRRYDASADNLSAGGTLNGFVRPDPIVLAWLASIKGHIELALYPEGGIDSIDMQFPEYQFPNEEFQIDTTKVTGAYRLVANIYSPRSTEPVSRVVYDKPITRASYRQQIRFYIRKGDVEDHRKAEVHVLPQNVPLTVSVFDSFTPDHDRENPDRDLRNDEKDKKDPQIGSIPNATVKFLNFDEYNGVTDKNGDHRISSVAAGSTYLIEVSAPGYLPTQQVVVVGSTPAYAPIHLVSKSKIDFMKYLTNNTTQRSDRALLLGRVFTEGSTIPAAGEQVAISYRQKKPWYFTQSGFPDAKLDATSEFGLFLYYNLVPSFRTVYRTSTFSPAQIGLRAGYASYVEFGRGGTSSLKGKLVDPFRGANLKGSMPEAEVRFAGDGDWQTVSDDQGKFEFENVDLPRGVVTLQVDAEGYPRTMHNISWHGRERGRELSLFMAQEEVLQDNDPKASPVNRDSRLGTILGTAEAKFFAKKNGKRNRCVYVKLEADDIGQAEALPAPLVPGNGPYPLLEAGSWTDKGLCLTRKKPAFKHYNLPSGRYVLRLNDENGAALRSHVVYVDNGAVTVVVN